MPRCAICDYSPDAPSILYSSSEIPRGPPIYFIKDKDTHVTICSTCEETSSESQKTGVNRNEKEEEIIIDATFDSD